MKSVIDRTAHKPSDDPMCDWHADVQMANGNYICIQFGTRGIDKDTADEIVRRLASVDLP